VITAYEGENVSGYRAGLSPGQRRKMTLEQALAFIANDPPSKEVTP
jgi:hypothetical protein